MILCMKFGWNLMKTWRSRVSKIIESEILQSAPNHPRCHNIFIFWQMAITYYPLSLTLHSFMTDLFYHKDWPRLDKNCRRSSVLKFPAPCGHVLTNISKCHKISITLHSPITTLVVIKFGSDRLKIGGVLVAFWNSHRSPC